LKSNPFWAVFIIVFMILPIVGAVIHILLKAFGRRGLDNAPTLPQGPPDDITDESNGTPGEEDEKKPPESNHLK
jgi:hypothetical protein